MAAMMVRIQPFPRSLRQAAAGVGAGLTPAEMVVLEAVVLMRIRPTQEVLVVPERLTKATMVGPATKPIKVAPVVVLVVLVETPPGRTEGPVDQD
jgi:predicted exporter